ncbi:phenazine antibiotic biosynthesis protein [Pantoea sp. FN0307]|uniref:phenazine antibiotic biosynthesis protein n=1 Tax=Pantoea sp. FN0307 TaxID=3418560 RepID=UPI003CF93B7F
MQDYSHKIDVIMNAAKNNCADDFVQALMQWHFSPETGSDFWLGMLEHLNFDPCTSIKNFKDLQQFNDISTLLRKIPVTQLIPRGLPKNLSSHVYESGGTTGTPKYVIAYDEWIQTLISWRMSNYQNRPGRPAGNTLAAIPTGPHIVGAINKERAQRLGGFFFSIDIDPRWVKLLINEGDTATVRRYTQHLVEQVHNTLVNQDIRFLVTTPPVLRELLKRPEVVTQMRRSLAQITLGGTELNLDEIKFIASEILPDCEFSASYGSTSALGVSRSLLITADSEQIIYDSFSPFITYDVVDDSTLRTVDYGERGTVIVTHLSPYAFYPRVIERDTAIRLPGVLGMAGDRLANIAPQQISEGRQVIEGVY